VVYNVYIVENSKEITMNENQLVRDFLGMKIGMVFDGIKAQRAMTDEWGITIDWHVFTNVMDEMTRYSLAEVVETKNGRTSFLISWPKKV